MNQKEPTKQELDNLVSLYKARDYDSVKLQAATLANHYPSNTFVWKLLGGAHHELGELGPSLEASQKVVELDPQNPEAHNNLGGVLFALGRLSEAERHYSEATKINPHYSEAYKNIGNLFLLKSDMRNAESSFRKAVRTNPKCAESLNKLALIYISIRRLKEALVLCQEAISIRPDYPDAYNNLGNILRFKGDIDSAESCYRKAIHIKEDFSGAYSNLGSVLRAKGKTSEAVTVYEKALLYNTESAEARTNLANVHRDMGNFRDAESYLRETVDKYPNYINAYSNLLFLYASLNVKSEKYLVQAKKYGETASYAINQKFCYLNYASQKSVLKVGFVSGDLKNHPVGYFLENVLFELAEQKIELYAYTMSSIEDSLTVRIKPTFKKWNSIVGKSWVAAAREINEENIDILIDLAGHTGTISLPIFLYKPAPIQISWLGYFASTGMKEIDYILGDRYVTPMSDAKNFVEQIYQLPNSYLCYSKPEFEIDVNSLPAIKNGYITFGCFSKISRMNDEVVSVWSKILKKIPNSKLSLKDKQFSCLSEIRSIEGKFSAFGVGSDQLIFESHSKRKDYYKSYNKIDIALAPFPYAGATTCVDSLWMGVPVVALQGDQFLSHLAETVLHNADLQRFIAINKNHYVNIAISLSTDLTALSKLRSNLRDQLESSPLFDNRRFATDFNVALRNIWKVNVHR
jgi:predicted O-linked N-acetylglucosamine transferase (SPINDLY family)